jgi:hypothetical protein
MDSEMVSRPTVGYGRPEMERGEQMIQAANINELIDECHESGNTSFAGCASGHIALRTKHDGARWHYYAVNPRTGRYELTGTTEGLEQD